MVGRVRRAGVVIVNNRQLSELNYNMKIEKNENRNEFMISSDRN